MAVLGAALLPLRVSFLLVLFLAQAFVFLWFLWMSYDIRMYPIKDFGYLVHEFDPWFNYRATEYLAEHGLDKFFKWYDYMSWYPLGRPVGTTIFPGMQMTGVAIWEAMKRVPAQSIVMPENIKLVRKLIASLKKRGFGYLPIIPKKLEYVPMSVNDICCMMPPWFGIAATVFTGLLTYEITRSRNAAVVAAGVMAIIPAHLMRSMGGEFDNEAVAMTAICMTFWLWLVSIRTPRTWPVGVLVGISYVYMVAVWGGYIFVLNMIGLHAAVLVGLGRFNSGVHKAYTLFFVIGTFGAIQVPVVGWQPLRSFEQMAPLLVFLGYQVLAFCDSVRRNQKMAAYEFAIFRAKVVVGFLCALVGIAVLLWPTGYFGPLSARIRGLFVKHTKTGNPLVDSVAEHQPASSGIYASYLNLPLDYAVLGAFVTLLKRNNGAYFAAIYAAVAIHFSGKMSRLILICAPITAVACGIFWGFVLDFITDPVLILLGKKGFEAPEGYKSAADTNSKADVKESNSKADAKGKSKAEPKAKKGKKANAKVVELAEWEEEERPGGMAHFKRDFKEQLKENIPAEYLDNYYNTRIFFDSSLGALGRVALSILAAFYLVYLSGMDAKVATFIDHCHNVARGLANPKVVFKTQDRVKGSVIIDDYLKGYQWIDANTPKDARVMAWWDYGYQITGIAKRTSVADGNTWNHEHIATLGRTLTSPEKKAWNAIRHWADYVLVWAGGRGDDLGKSPHLARIGNSVFPDHCGDDDPKCMKFGFNGDRSPTPMMANSLLYKAVQHNMKEGVRLNARMFKEVHTTKNGLLRVFEVMNVSQETKEWIADPANRVCDAPGSWYCVGQYPPALQKLIAKRRSFAQVGDFNDKGGGKSAYTKMIEKEKHGEF